MILFIQSIIKPLRNCARWLAAALHSIGIPVAAFLPPCRALSRALNTVLFQLQLFGDWSPQRVSCIISSTKPVLLVIDCNKHSAFKCSQARRMSLDKLHSDGLLI
jgi:hypothetical protein